MYQAGDWTWKVLKTYQRPDKEHENSYARWLVAVKSPYTHGSWDMGDSYVRDIRRSRPELMSSTEEWVKYYK